MIRYIFIINSICFKPAVIAPARLIAHYCQNHDEQISRRDRQLCETPISKFHGGLSHLTAPQLGAAAIQGSIARLSPDNETPKIVEAYFGNVLSAGIGQAPCRQAILGAGLSEETR